MPIQLTVTTVTNQRLVVKGDDEDTLLVIKNRLQNKEGIPPEQQVLWFPVPEGTSGALSVTMLPMWLTSKDRFSAELQAELLARPLKRFEDSLTLGHARAEQASEMMTAFLVLSLRGNPSLSACTAGCA